jgi:protein arginine phosphatase
MPVILFVCTAKRFRSPLAAAYTERKVRTEDLPGEWNIFSAGTWADNGLPAHPNAISAATLLGLNLSKHRSHMVNKTLVSVADLIIVMELGHKEALEFEFPSILGRIALLGALANEPDVAVPDPSQADFKESDTVARTIAEYIELGFKEMIYRAKSYSNNRRNNRLNNAFTPTKSS